MTTPIINWKITDLNIYTDQGIEGIIHSIKWQCTASDGQKEFSRNGSAILPHPEAGRFIPLTQTTKEMVEGWLFTSFGNEGKNLIEQSVINLFDSASQPQAQIPNWLEKAQKEIEGVK